MRTLAKMTAGVVVLLAFAGCSSGLESGISALEAPSSADDRQARE